jgi:hypothetical protein
MRSKSLLKAGRTPLVGILCATLAVAPAWAQVPVISLSDLVNQGSDYAQRELQSRGYVFIQSDQRGSKTWQYWWQNRDNTCARVAHVDGRASSIVSVSPTDCNQYQTAQAQGQQSKDSGGLSTGAKVAIGAAALLGVAALAHRSHERDEEKHKTEQQVAEYDRGYRDGLYHQPFHDYNRSQSYVDGYNAGQQKRDAETRYRSPWGHHSGQAAYVSLNDLVEARASSLDDTMRQRGFVNKGGYKSDNRAITTWWNVSTRQCMQVIVSDGRVQWVGSIAEGNCT